MSLTTREQVALEHLTTLDPPQARRPAESLSPGFVLPDQPLVTIEARRSRFGVDLHDLWTYRELLYFLTWRDVKVRYKQTALGVTWVVIQPLLMTLVFTLFLGRLARVPSDGIPYPLFVYSGLLSWTFCASAVNNGGYSLLGSAHLITKVYFPRVILPTAAVGARIVDLVVALVIMFGLMIYYGVPVTPKILLLPALVVLVTLLALAIGTGIAALNVKYRDIGVALPVLIQLWMFASPVLYPASLVPAEWRRVYALNPMNGIVEGFRAALFWLELDLPALAVSTLLTIVLLVVAAYIFRRMEKGFADVV